MDLDVSTRDSGPAVEDAPLNVLCVEDDEGLLYLLRKSLVRENFRVSVASNGEEGLNQLRQSVFDVMLIDHEMPMMTGVEAIRRIREMNNPIPIIMVTGAGNEEIAVDAIRAGANDYLVKDAALGYLKILPTVIRQVVRERELSQAKRAAQRALELESERARLLSQFIQNASHEFRTPLTVIQSSAYLLSRISQEPKQIVHIQRISEQAEAIQKLVNHLMHLSELDNMASLETGPVELNALLANAVDQKADAIAEKQMRVEVKAPDRPLQVLGDPDELVDALCELIDNACQYSEAEGLISITLEAGPSTAIISICDNGVGMSPAQLSRMFERFYRADTGRTRRGFGLGLPIAARIIELHRGTIHAASQPGAGTTITVTLPTIFD